jgi:predicted peptidase
MDLSAELQKEFGVDGDRICLCGHSIGGAAVWNLLATYPDKFAAAVVLSATDADPAKAPLFAHVPVWVFHGGRDKTAPPETSRKMVAALKQAGGTPRYTEYKVFPHDISQPVCQEEELLPWLFTRKRTPATAAATGPASAPVSAPATGPVSAPASRPGSAPTSRPARGGVGSGA